MKENQLFTGALATIILLSATLSAQNVSASSCAALEYRGSCGLGGNKAFVVNKLTDSSVKATVKVRWNEKGKGYSINKVVIIPAGAEKFFRCTSTGSPGAPGTVLDLSIVGCEKR